jgi:alpha-tubulin suppressor-like RCC1 family protein
MLGSSVRALNDVTPVPVQDLADAVHLAVGTAFACAMRRGGTVACWGSAHFGQLGNGTSTEISTPVIVPLIADAVSVVAGAGVSCALDKQGVVWCWGLGDWESSPTVVPPRPVPPLRRARRLSALYQAVCAFGAEGLIGCIDAADLATKPGAPTLARWALSSLKGAKAVSGTPRDSGAAVLAAGQVVLLRPTPTGTDPTIIPVVGLRDAIDVAGNDSIECILRRTGRVACIMAGPRVDGSPNEQPRMVDVRGVRSGMALANSDYDYAFVEKSGKMVHWSVGSPGFTTDEGPFMCDARSLAVGSQFTCVLRRGGQVACSGANMVGQLGIGDLASPRTYSDERGSYQSGLFTEWFQVKGLDQAVSVAAGVEHACAVRRDGRVLCWGSNAHQEVGAATPPFTNRPATVVGVGDSVDVVHDSR